MNRLFATALSAALAALAATRETVVAAEADTASPVTSPSLANAFWIWHSYPEPLCHFRKEFVLEDKPASGSILITADNGYQFYINGSVVGADIGADAVYWKSVERYDITRLLHAGKNVVAVRATDLGNAGGLLASVKILVGRGPAIEIVTDTSWRVTKNADPTGYTHSDFKENSEWQAAKVIGPLGIEPWGKLLFPGPVSPAHAEGVGKLRPPGKDFRWPEGVVFLRGFAPLSSTPDAQQAIWRIGSSRAYLELDTIGPAMLGRSLHILSPASRDGEAKLLLDAGNGWIGSPSVSFDGKEILFSMVPAGEKFFHIYRIAVSGSSPQAVTSGPFHDFDPDFLPDGRIVFSSTRSGHREEYHGNAARSLFVMNANGSDIHPITHHIVGDMEPRVTASGQIAFIRQDNFFERAKVETQIHSVRPDGTAGQVLLGPNRQAIGYDRANAAETDTQWLRNYGFGSVAPLPDGRVAALSSLGLVVSGNEVQPLANVRPAAELMDIAPLPDGRLLCTASGLGIGVVDPRTGDVSLIYSKDPGQIHSAVYLGPRPRPALPRATVDSSAAKVAAATTGFLLGQNAFFSKQTNAEMARVKAIRVLQGVPFTTRSARHQYAHLGVEAVELGSVPLAPDGSFFIEVPADRALALQAVDGEGRSVVNELSWIYVRPGEQRSCTGCHSQREIAPPNHHSILALRSAPVKLLGEGNPHRFRGNNAANGGVLNLQFDRFREAASIDLRGQPINTKQLLTRGEEVRALAEQLKSAKTELKISAAERLAVFRDRAAAPILALALRDQNAAVRMNAALALATCGARESIEPLLEALNDSDPATAQSANLALENLTGHAERFNAYSTASERQNGEAAWRKWRASNDWGEVERELITRLGSDDSANVQLAITALGHIGGEPTRKALRDFVAHDSGNNLRATLAAMRALAHLKDTNSIALLARILTENLPKRTVKAEGSHEFGWLQRPVQLAAAAAEALGWIGDAEAERVLLDSFSKLEDFTYYTLQNGDHEWLKGCHSSLPHYRITEALDAIGSRDIKSIVPTLLKSVPIDTDRALLFENDAYETITARVINRSGLGEEIIETCLAVLGKENTSESAILKTAITNSPPAVSVGPLDPKSRAAQLLSVVCLDSKYAPQIRATFDRFRAEPPSRARSWSCFYLARTLGKLRDASSVDSLMAALERDPTEASFGLVDPPNVFLTHAMTPCYRAATAYALGQIGDRRASGALLRAVAEFDNAMDVRNAAAHALGLIGDREILPAVEKLAADYPEVATRKVLLGACAAMNGNKGIRTVAQQSH
jgi:HEAT repeat protein